MNKIIIKFLKHVSKFTNTLIKYLSSSIRFKTIKNIYDKFMYFVKYLKIFEVFKLFRIALRILAIFNIIFALFLIFTLSDYNLDVLTSIGLITYTLTIFSMDQEFICNYILSLKSKFRRYLRPYFIKYFNRILEEDNLILSKNTISKDNIKKTIGEYKYKEGTPMPWTNIALLFTFSVLAAYGYLHWDEIKQDTNFIAQTFTGLFTLIGNYFFGDNEPRGGDEPRGNEPDVPLAQPQRRRNNGLDHVQFDY